MDYGKSGAPKMSKKGPKHEEHNAHGSDKKPFGQRPSKEDLLARMKKAQNPEGENPMDVPSKPEDDFATDEAKGKKLRGRPEQDWAE